MSGKNSTNLKQTKGGEVIKQGDSSSIFEYELLDMLTLRFLFPLHILHV